MDMTYKTRRQLILEYLMAHPEGVDDDMLAKVLGKRRQSVNQECHKLVAEGLIRREKLTGAKVANFLAADLQDLPSFGVKPLPSTQVWHTEAYTQNLVVVWLKKKGWTIIKVVDTASKEHGPDVSAERNGRQMLVTVKGYPKGTPRTRPSTQAGHWFKHGLHDILVWRGIDKKMKLAFALPDFKRYRDLASKVLWLKPIISFSFFWVSEDGSVEEQ